MYYLNCIDLLDQETSAAGDPQHPHNASGKTVPTTPRKAVGRRHRRAIVPPPPVPLAQPAYSASKPVAKLASSKRRYEYEPSYTSSDTAVARETQTVKRMRKCALCQHEFLPEALKGCISYKSVLELRNSWGVNIRRNGQVPHPAFLYQKVQLCIFCSQFFDVYEIFYEKPDLNNMLPETRQDPIKPELLDGLRLFQDSPDHSNPNLGVEQAPVQRLNFFGGHPTASRTDLDATRLQRDRRRRLEREQRQQAIRALTPDKKERPHELPRPKSAAPQLATTNRVLNRRRRLVDPQSGVGRALGQTNQDWTIAREFLQRRSAGIPARGNRGPAEPGQRVGWAGGPARDKGAAKPYTTDSVVAL